MTVLKNIFTESNNEIFSWPKIGAGLGLVTLIVTAGVSVFRGDVDDAFYPAFGAAICAIIGAGAAGAKFTPEAKDS